MEFRELIADFAKRHSVNDLTAAEKAATETPPSFGSSEFMQV